MTGQKNGRRKGRKAAETDRKYEIKKDREENKKRGRIEDEQEEAVGEKICESSQLVVCSLSNAAAAIEGENPELCNQTGMRDGDFCE
jgi:hypothetical protein